jgi:hypothetical protein
VLKKLLLRSVVKPVKHARLNMLAVHRKIVMTRKVTMINVMGPNR